MPTTVKMVGIIFYEHLYFLCALYGVTVTSST